MKLITYGLGGHCDKCTKTHDHPLHNIISEVKTPDEESTPNDNTEPI